MNKDIQQQIDAISTSALEFRKSLDRIVFGRLKEFFNKKGKEISRDSNVNDLLGKKFIPSDWYELEEVGLRVPELRRHKAFPYVVTAYVITIIVIWVIVLVTYFEAFVVAWQLPLVVIAGGLLALTFSPIVAIMMIFKKRFLPVDTVNVLIDGIITENWPDLLVDDKRKFKEILGKELTRGEINNLGR